MRAIGIDQQNPPQTTQRSARANLLLGRRLLDLIFRTYVRLKTRRARGELLLDRQRAVSI